jgi:hypothetical protein
MPPSPHPSTFGLTHTHRDIIFLIAGVCVALFMPTKYWVVDILLRLCNNTGNVTGIDTEKSCFSTRN